MLLLGKKISARQARNWGFITEVFPDETFQSDVQKIIKQFAQLPPNVSTFYCGFNKYAILEQVFNLRSIFASSDWSRGPFSKSKCYAESCPNFAYFIKLL